MDKEVLQELYLTYLKDEGYRGEVDEGGDIQFKYEGRWYYILIEEDDEYCCCMLFPDFWEIETEEEKAQAVVVADAINREYKYGKLFTDEDDDGNMTIFAQVSSFLNDLNDFKAFFTKMLDVLQQMSEDFVRAMEEWPPVQE